MTSKYIDLAEQILDNSNFSNTTSFVLGIKKTLRWLDDHSDRLPVRTITESELEDATREVWGYCARESDIRFLAYFGILVVPDPEPSNAEKLKALCSDWTIGRNCLEDEDLSDYLDRLGVKAPGADDDQ